MAAPLFVDIRTPFLINNTHLIAPTCFLSHFCNFPHTVHREAQTVWYEVSWHTECIVTCRPADCNILKVVVYLSDYSTIIMQYKPQCIPFLLRVIHSTDTLPHSQINCSAPKSLQALCSVPQSLLRYAIFYSGHEHLEHRRILRPITSPPQ